jgi:hypothetical protein
LSIYRRLTEYINIATYYYTTYKYHDAHYILEETTMETKPYNPSPKIAEILDWCYDKITSVPYNVTSRWLFYRLLQEIGGKYAFGKKHYRYFLKWTSVARKRYYKDWTPTTLVDDTREIHYRGYGFESFEGWLKQFEKEEVVLDKLRTQDFIVQVWFEAEAMFSQFNYYTSPYFVSLVPFKGDPSLDYKHKVAKELEELAAYGKPMVVLYFGDWDEKGRQIPISALKDIRSWCSADFQFIRCGINDEHVKKFHIPERFDKPGQYQWEALTDDQAKKLILSNLEKYVDLRKVRRILEEEKLLTKRFQEMLKKLMET